MNIVSPGTGKINKFTLFFFIVLGALSFVNFAQAATVSMSSNISFCWSATGPGGMSASGCSSSFSYPSLPGGTYTINGTPPSGYQLSSISPGQAVTIGDADSLNWAISWSAITPPPPPPPPPPSSIYTLTITITGTGNVSDGVDTCAGPGTCSKSYPQNSTVTLTASGGTFSGWGGACSSFGTNSVCSGNLTSDLNVTAGFSSGTVTPTLPPSPGSGLQYFGYWRDSDFEDYVCEIQTHSNYSMIYGTLYNPIDIIPPDSRFKKASNSGISSFGIYGPSALNGFVVRDDADVPFDWSATKASIEAEIITIKNAYPNAHPLINLAGRFRTIPGFSLPSGVEWVGLECYDSLAECQSMFNFLQPLLPANGRVWILLAAATYWGSDSELAQRAVDIYNWTKTEGSIIGLMGFVWQSSMVPPQLATRDLPQLRAALTDIGNAITGRNGGVSSAVCQSLSTVTPGPTSIPPPGVGTPTPVPTYTSGPTPIPPISGGPTYTSGPTPIPPISGGPTAMNIFGDFNAGTVPKILASLACYFVQFAMIVFAIAIVIAGITFVLARGNASAHEKAKKTLLYSVLGGIIIYGVYTIIMSVAAFLGVADLSFLPLTCS